jgi:hypothetical protein
MAQAQEAEPACMLAGRDGGYGFVMYAYDANPDRYRIVVWPLDEGRSQGRD